MKLGHNTEIEIEKGILLDYLFTNGFEKKNPRIFFIELKFSFSEKATKICAIYLMVLSFT
jgi:hypothetical protein